MLELLIELAEPLAFALGALVFSIAGAIIDLTAVSTYSGGQTMLALWLAFVGSAALYAGVFLFGSEARKRLAARGA
ncbi:hypothetical protein [Salarchaeum sp. JOR-1]|uniref:hypothetical protein n=1 Tax=Salarchaeum sp. JOR-1 TaxID=2599399 RepID=UPI0011989A2E|nr:hypothetical protein [Salarchaeum sp. JOR-1]QDX40335.1 hypothetical protein FQU85_05265 [Salarchaeum sp. JOR-1]